MSNGNNLGQFQNSGTGQAFLPAMPSAADIFADLAKKTGGGWDTMLSNDAATSMQKRVSNPAVDLAKSYLRLFSGRGNEKDADAVLEDLLNNSVRKTFKPGAMFETIEKSALYAAERTGQNGFMVYILAMMVKGRDAPAPATKRPAKKKKK